jgi:hypothetical protein
MKSGDLLYSPLGKTLPKKNINTYYYHSKNLLKQWSFIYCQEYNFLWNFILFCGGHLPKTLMATPNTSWLPIIT